MNTLTPSGAALPVRMYERESDVAPGLEGDVTVLSHPGGPIGVKFVDNPYGDNVGGGISWKLQRYHPPVPPPPPEELPVVSLSVNPDHATATEGADDYVELIFSRAPLADGSKPAVTVQYTLSGTAEPQVDYEGPTGGAGFAGVYKVTISANADEASVQVRATSDALSEGVESLSAALRATGSYFFANAFVQAAVTQPAIGATIQPDQGQQGITGDLVPSVKAQNPLKHYVSPKTANSFVRLQAVQLPQGIAWGKDVEWRIDGVAAAGVMNAPDKIDVPRDTPKRVEVVVVDKNNGQELDKMVVWIVWAEVAGGAPQRVPDRPILVGGNRQGTEISFDRLAAFAIQPAALFDLTQDVPALNGPAVGPAIPGNAPDGNPLAGGVNARWDTSRRITMRAGTQPANIGSQVDPFVDYPIEDWLGNDDSSTFAEDNDPYDAAALGKLTQTDNVRRGGPSEIAMWGGDTGAFYTSKIWFEDFARLQLGTDGAAKWFRISDGTPWRVEFHMKKLLIPESLWAVDADGDGDMNGNNPVTERNWGGDANGDGDAADDLAYWDQDPNAGSFAQQDNAGIPARGQ